MVLENHLQDECVYLGKKIFRKELPARISIEYERACRLILKTPSTTVAKDEKVQLLLDQSRQLNRDIEAIELVLRLRDKNNLLTKKFHILSFLVETDVEFVSYFSEEHPSRIKSFFVLGYFCFYTVFKYLRGVFYLMRGLSDV